MRKALAPGDPVALARELIEMRRRDLRVLVVTTEVSVPEIIGQDEDDVRLLRRSHFSGDAHQTKRTN